MVHVKKCPLTIKNKTHERGNPRTEFYKDGKPQIYCMGWIDNNEPLDECKNCPDWVYGEQCQKDFDEALRLWKEKHIKGDSENGNERL